MAFLSFTGRTSVGFIPVIFWGTHAHACSYTRSDLAISTGFLALFTHACSRAFDSNPNKRRFLAIYFTYFLVSDWGGCSGIDIQTGNVEYIVLLFLSKKGAEIYSDDQRLSFPVQHVLSVVLPPNPSKDLKREDQHANTEMQH